MDKGRKLITSRQLLLPRSKSGTGQGGSYLHSVHTYTHRQPNNHLLSSTIPLSKVSPPITLTFTSVAIPLLEPSIGHTLTIGHHSIWLVSVFPELWITPWILQNNLSSPPVCSASSQKTKIIIPCCSINFCLSFHSHHIGPSLIIKTIIQETISTALTKHRFTEAPQ